MQVLFGRKKAPKYPQRQGSNVSKNFAEAVLELEGQLGVECSIKTVKRLMKLYSAAIEHYAALKDNKYLHYQERLQSLLSRTDVLLLLEDPSKTISRSPQEKKTDLQKTYIQRIKSTERLIELRTDKTLESYRSTSRNTYRKIKENLDSQNNSLVQKLAQRQKTKTPVIGRQLKLEAFEAEVEKVIEYYIEKKAAAKQKIKDKHRDQLEELKELGEPFRTVRELTKQKIKQEIEEKLRKIDSEKKLRIGTLRSVHFIC